MPSGYQLKAARSLLGWGQQDLARASKVDITTIVRMERAGHKVVPTRPAILQDVIDALGRGGVVLTETGGVEPTKKPRR